MMRPIVRKILQVSLMLPIQVLTVPSAADTVFNGGGYSEGFIENLTCAHLNRSQVLSLNPLDQAANISPKNIRRTSQIERQFMLQKRMFECNPLAIHMAEKVIESNKGNLSQDVYEKTQEILFNSEKVSSALFASPFGIRKYMGQLNQLLVGGGKQRYNPADNSYPWIWPKHSMDSVTKALVVAFGSVSQTPAFDPDINADNEIRNFLTPYKHTPSGRGASPDEEELKDDAVLFAQGISAEQDALLSRLGQLRRESNEALLCLVKNGLPLNGSCPGFRTLAEIRKDQKLARSESVRIGLPLMSPFPTKIHKTILGDLNALCKSVQRADNAHREWMRNVRKGETHAGFTMAWMAMFGQSLAMAERTIGREMDFDRDVVQQGGRFRSCVLALARNTEKEIANCPCFDFSSTRATGLDADGNCNLGPVE